MEARMDKVTGIGFYKAFNLIWYNILFLNINILHCKCIKPENVIYIYISIVYLF